MKTAARTCLIAAVPRRETQLMNQALLMGYSENNDCDLIWERRSRRTERRRRAHFRTPGSRDRAVPSRKNKSGARNGAAGCAQRQQTGLDRTPSGPCSCRRAPLSPLLRTGLKNTHPSCVFPFRNNQRPAAERAHTREMTTASPVLGHAYTRPDQPFGSVVCVPHMIGRMIMLRCTAIR